MNPRYPVYVISKGRPHINGTAYHLDKIGVPYKLVIEPQEEDIYAERFGREKLLLTPFSNLGQGSIPVRNFVWEHSIQNGDKRHWILDDNIWGFFRLNRNRRIQVADGTIFRCCEDFTERYTNVPISGMDYENFTPKNEKHPPFRINTRVYSNLLIDNSLPIRWRGKYNEDTDLCLRVLKMGYAPILFKAFILRKATTLRGRGGNTDAIYKDTNLRLEFAQSLKEQHPDVVDIVWRFDRWHHKVNYNAFKNNKLIKREGLDIPKGVDNYGMKLVDWHER